MRPCQIVGCHRKPFRAVYGYVLCSSHLKYWRKTFEMVEWGELELEGDPLPGSTPIPTSYTAPLKLEDEVLDRDPGLKAYVLNREDRRREAAVGEMIRKVRNTIEQQ